MKSLAACVAACLCVVASSSFAKSKEFTILGGQKITAEVERGVPLPAASGGIKIEVAAFIVGDGKLVFTFGLFSAGALKKVIVEEVSGATALLMVNDDAPKQTKDYWKGDAVPLALTKSAVPWVWERGDTTKVFRFTVLRADKPEPIVLFQPAVYSGSTKRQLQQLAR